MLRQALERRRLDQRSEPEKVDPPGGTTGRVGYGTGVDEAPVPDAGSTIMAFRAKHALGLDPGVRAGSREENASNRNPFSRSSVVIAGTNAAHVVAVAVQ